MSSSSFLFDTFLIILCYVDLRCGSMLLQVCSLHLYHLQNPWPKSKSPGERMTNTGGDFPRPALFEALRVSTHFTVPAPHEGPWSAPLLGRKPRRGGGEAALALSLQGRVTLQRTTGGLGTCNQPEREREGPGHGARGSMSTPRGHTVPACPASPSTATGPAPGTSPRRPRVRRSRESAPRTTAGHGATEAACTGLGPSGELQTAPGPLDPPPGAP